MLQCAVACLSPFARPRPSPMSLTHRSLVAFRALLAVLSLCVGPSLLAGSRLVNFSVRNQVGTGDDVLVAGFVVAGAGTYPVLVRSVGPTLGAAPYNVPGTLADPRLRLFDSKSVQIGENLDWGGTTELTKTFQALGAFALPSKSKDAALLRSFPAGAFTCISDGGGSATGEALLEVYDALASPGADQALVNLSLRATLAANGNCIAGFVIAGDAPKTVLLRAAGPSLADFGLSNPHPNPSMALYQGQVLVAANTDWAQASNAAEIASTATRFGAFPFAASGSDAALLVTLKPGLYTVWVQGEDPTKSGVVLVELYDADVAGTTTPPNPPVLDPLLPVVTVEGPVAAVREGSDAAFTLRRTGSTAGPLTVSLQVGGTAQAGVDYAALATTATFTAGAASVTVPLRTLADALVEAPESVELRLVASSSYQLRSAGKFASAIIADGTALPAGWNGAFFNNTTLSGAPVFTHVVPTINFDWGAGSPDASVPVDRFSARWTGVLSVDVSQVYTFHAEADDGVWVWVDGQPVIRRPSYAWQPITGSIYLDALVRHEVRVEFKEGWSNAKMKLFWYAPGMLRQLVPERVVANAIPLPAMLTAPASVSAVVGMPFSLQVTGVGVTGQYSAAGLPEGLAIDPKYGLVAGVFGEAGVYDLVVSAGNATGAGSVRVRVTVVAADGVADTELWAGVQGGLSLVPDTLAPTSTGTVASLASPGGASGVFARRIRGLLLAPSTGNHTFWVKGGGACQFRLADSAQAADCMLRCSSLNAWGWNDQPSQRSEAVWLEAGKAYAFELLQKGSSASEDTAVVGWLTPGGVGAEPFSIVPGKVLSHAPGAAGQPASLAYVAALRPPSGVVSSGSGVLSAALNTAGTQALVTLQLSGVGSPVTAIRLLLFPDTINETRLLFMRDTTAQPVTWNIAAAGGQTAAQVLAALRSGQVTVRVETALNPGGELRAQLQPLAGSTLFTPPAEPVPLANTAISDADAARFLTQATFGPTLATISRLKAIGYEAWIAEQWALPASTNIGYIDTVRAAARAEDPTADVYSNTFNETWWKNAVTGPDQLRQRVAFALSELYVVSSDSSVYIDAYTSFYDMLVANASGRHRQLLQDVTLHPAMAQYLSMLRNMKPDLSKGQYPDENYARELMQLFSIGLFKLHPDGTLVLDERGLPIPTYTQEAIVGIAHVLTGWTYASTDPDYSYRWGEPDYRRPLQMYQVFHDTQPKRLIESVVLPEGRSGEADLASVLDLMHRHPNAGPFLARHLIQRLVSSNPSPAYVYRVARAFADNGAGVRGDMKAVVRAVLLDPEARRTPADTDVTRGKLREPLLRMTQLWRAMDAKPNGATWSYAWFRDDLGQEPLRSETVFNFFKPSFVPMGTLASAGLVAPEFQITTEAQVGSMGNTMEYLCSSWGATDPDKINIDLTSSRAALAKGPDQLLEHYNILFLQGRMSTALRTHLSTMLSTFPKWVDTDTRIRSVLHTLLCSPDYVVER